MFAASALLLVSLISSVAATPVAFRPFRRGHVLRAPELELRDSNSSSSSFSGFNNYDGNPNLASFDNFYGSGNFLGYNNEIIVKEQSVQCKEVQIRQIQQKLAIIREITKRIITEQICDVETQTIVLAQHNGHLKVLRDDIQRKTVERQIGYDQSISSKFSQIVNSDGSLNDSDFGFNGNDVGKNTNVPNGNNWDNNSSPAKQSSIDQAIKSASKIPKSASSSSSTSASSTDASSTSASSTEASSTSSASTSSSSTSTSSSSASSSTTSA